MTFDKAERQFLTDEEYIQGEWDRKHRHRIAEMVRVASVEDLREIASLIGYAVDDQAVLWLTGRK